MVSEKQEVRSLDNSVVTQVGGDVNINYQGLSAADVIAIVKSTVASELAIYSCKAETEAQERLQKFSDDLVGQLAEKVAEKLDRFNEPALQFAVREAALGYVRSGSETDEANLIDLMLERVKVEEHTTKQKLIDQAIKIVPTLSAESLAILSLFAFRQLTCTGVRDEYIKWLLSINCVVDAVAKVNTLDVEYLIQAGCATGLLGLKKFLSWEESCLKTADLFFRHQPPEEEIKAFMDSIGIEKREDIGGFSTVAFGKEAQEFLVFIATTMIILPEMQMGFNLVNRNALEEAFQKRGLSHLMDPLKRFIESAQPYSKEEVAQFFVNLNPNWHKVIELLDDEQFSTLKLTPVGAYIGIRQLTLLTGREIPIEIFYE